MVIVSQSVLDMSGKQRVVVGTLGKQARAKRTALLAKSVHLLRDVRVVAILTEANLSCVFSRHIRAKPIVQLLQQIGHHSLRQWGVIDFVQREG